MLAEMIGRRGSLARIWEHYRVMLVGIVSGQHKLGWNYHEFHANGLIFWQQELYIKISFGQLVDVRGDHRKEEDLFLLLVLSL